MGLHAATMALAMVFVWRLCVLVEEMARHAGSTAVAHDAGYRPWLFMVSVVFPCIVLLRPAGDGLLSLGVMAVALLYVACVASLMMGLMATTARMCMQLARADGEAAL